MIVGNGLIASAFIKYQDLFDDCVVFASGVSNSLEKDINHFNTEKRLLIETIENNQNKVFIYFSTCSIDNKMDSPYSFHKKNMEGIVELTNNYHIFRLPQLAGNSINKKLFFNHIVEKVRNGELIEIWKDAIRNVIDVDDVVTIIKTIINQKRFLNQIRDVASPYTIRVLDILTVIEEFFNKKANYYETEKHSSIQIDIEYLNTIINFNELFDNSFNEYLNKILVKYY